MTFAAKLRELLERATKGPVTLAEALADLVEAATILRDARDQYPEDFKRIPMFVRMIHGKLFAALDRLNDEGVKQ